METNFCEKCNHTGYISVKDKDGYEYLTYCDCYKPVMALKRLESQGLGRLLDKCTFDSFKQNTSLQTTIYNKAKQFCKEKNDWFAILGQSGVGKTHICCAILNDLVYNHNKAPNFVSWVKFIELVNGLAKEGNTSAFYAEMDAIVSYDLVYIDDLFKPTGQGLMPTSAEVRRAYDIINDRMIAGKQTIISSERTMSELKQIDEAIASRIWEMTGGVDKYLINIGKQQDVKEGKNYRFSK